MNPSSRRSGALAEHREKVVPLPHFMPLATPSGASPAHAKSALLSGGYGVTEERIDGRRVGEHGVPREPQALERTSPRPLVPGPARVLYNHGYVAEVGPVAYRRLDPDLRGNPADRERVYAQVSQGHIEEGSLEGAHGDFVGDRFTRQRGALRHDPGLGGRGGERRHHVLYLIDTLPDHCLPDLP